MERKQLEKIKKEAEDFLEVIQDCLRRADYDPIMGKSISYSKEAGQLKRSFLTLKYKIGKLL